MIVIDAARVVLFVGGTVLCGWYLVRRWPTCADRFERARALGMALALFLIAGSRITQLGNPIEWQFWAAIAVFALVGYSTRKAVR